MMFRRAFLVFSITAVVCAGTPARAGAQDTPKEVAAAIKAGFVADLDELQGKFVGLAEAFPQDKYTWRPMEGVRSVSEVFMLAAFEGYTFIPASFGAKPAALGTREEMAKLRSLTDKAEVVAHLKKGFAHAKQEMLTLDPATLTGKHKVMGTDMTVSETQLHISGDLHEHLGQLIAYARMNHIVPPWSK
jgi:DinB superfamily